jgi:cytosine/adenosine deaminase-related metal-dependent hydrolase
MLAQPRYAGGTFEGGADAATVEDVVRWGSAGGAHILGLPQCGTISVGMQADLAIYRLDDPRYFGLHDIAIGPVACGGRASLKALLLNGRPIVEEDVIPGVDLDAMRRDALAAVRTLQQRAAV